MNNTEIIKKVCDYLKPKKGNQFAENLYAILSVDKKTFKSGEPCLNPKCLKDKPFCRACHRVNAQGEVEFEITEGQKMAIIKQKINPKIYDQIVYGEGEDDEK